MVPVDSLIPYARNARTHSEEQIAQIAASIREFGWTNPILTDGDKGVIAGHGRLAAARKLELTEVPVIELGHLSPEQKKAYILADNRIALNSGWDEELLKLELQELQGVDFDLDLLGFGDDEIERAVAGIGGVVIDVHQQRRGIQQGLGFLPHTLMRGGVQRDGEVNVQRLGAGLNDGVGAGKEGEVCRHAIFQHGDDVLAHGAQAQCEAEDGAHGIAIRPHMRDDGDALRRAHGGDDFGGGGVRRGGDFLGGWKCRER